MRPDEQLGPKFLLYHDVVRAARGDVELARAGFRRHFGAVVSAGYRVVPMSAFLDGEPLGSRDVIVTVDDGARSFLDVIRPELAVHGAAATVFFPTGFAGRRVGDVAFMDWDDLAKLRDAGFEIGGHGTDHLPLNQIDPERMRADVLDSAKELRERGFETRVFAYPFGRYDDATKAAVREAGYEAAFTVMIGGYDRFEIRRRLFTGLEDATATRFVLSDRFFSLRETARSLTPKSLLKQEKPVTRDRWGIEAFGVVRDDG